MTSLKTTLKTAPAVKTGISTRLRAGKLTKIHDDKTKYKRRSKYGLPYGHDDNGGR